MKWLPGIFLFVFSDAERKLSRIAERGHIDPIRPPAADVQQDQLKGAAKGAIRSCDVGKNVLARPEVQLMTHRPVDHHQRRGKVRGRLHAVDVEALIAGGADQR